VSGRGTASIRGDVRLYPKWPKKWRYSPLDTYMIAVLKVLAFNRGGTRIVISNGMREQLKRLGWVRFRRDAEGYTYSLTRLGEKEIAVFEAVCEEGV